MRSASALAAGTVREVAAVALPIGFRRGRLYRSLVDVTLQFLIEDVGGVQAAQPSEQKLGEDFLLRRAAGNGIELMGVIAFRASPVWVLAALADVAGFGRQLIPEIAESLKKEGLLAPDGSVRDDGAAAHGARAQLRPARRERQRAAARRRRPARRVAQVRSRSAAAAGAAIAVGRTPSRRVWQDLRATAEREQRSVFEVSSLLAVSAVGELPERARVLSKAAAIVLRHGGAAVSNASARPLSAVAAANARGRASSATACSSSRRIRMPPSAHSRRRVATLHGPLARQALTARSVGGGLARLDARDERQPVDPAARAITRSSCARRRPSAARPRSIQPSRGARAGRASRARAARRRSAPASQTAGAPRPTTPTARPRAAHRTRSQASPGHCARPRASGDRR